MCTNFRSRLPKTGVKLKEGETAQVLRKTSDGMNLKLCKIIMKRRGGNDDIPRPLSPTGWLLVQQEEKRGWLPEQLTREVQSEHIRLGLVFFYISKWPLLSFN